MGSQWIALRTELQSSTQWDMRRHNARHRWGRVWADELARGLAKGRGPDRWRRPGRGGGVLTPTHCAAHRGRAVQHPCLGVEEGLLVLL